MRSFKRGKAVIVAVGLLFGAFVAPFGCTGEIAPGEPCDSKGEQACADNKEMSCGEDLTWEVAEDCGDSKTCVIKSGGDADCE